MASIPHMRTPLKLALAVVATGLLGYFLVRMVPEIRRSLTLRDSIAYWSAGRLLIERRDPYDQVSVLELERQHGYGADRPLVLRTPPWSLWMVLSLGLMGPLPAWCVWISLCLGSLLVAMRLCRRLYGEATPRDLFSIAGYLFAPIPACLVSGQMGLALLLGVILFLWLENRKPLLAGAALVLPFAKPHLLSVFWLILALWMVLRRRSSIALGFGLAFATATGFALALDPALFHQYRGMLRSASIGTEFIPAVSGVVRLIFFRSHFWVQFVPLALGILWSLWFFRKQYSSWSWQQHGPALLVVSVLVSPYSWLADECILLPAILQGVTFVYEARAGLKLRTKVVLVMFALLNLLLLLILRSKIPFATGIYFWSSLVWFGWYFYTRRVHSRSKRNLTPNNALQPAS